MVQAVSCFVCRYHTLYRWASRQLVRMMSSKWLWRSVSLGQFRWTARRTTCFELVAVMSISSAVIQLHSSRSVYSVILALLAYLFLLVFWVSYGMNMCLWVQSIPCSLSTLIMILFCLCICVCVHACIWKHCYLFTVMISWNDFKVF